MFVNHFYLGSVGQIPHLYTLLALALWWCGGVVVWSASLSLGGWLAAGRGVERV